MGWNTLDVVNPQPLLAGIATGPDGLHAYFVHSFHLCRDRAAPRGGEPTTAGR